MWRNNGLSMVLVFLFAVSLGGQARDRLVTITTNRNGSTAAMRQASAGTSCRDTSGRRPEKTWKANSSR